MRVMAKIALMFPPSGGATLRRIRMRRTALVSALAAATLVAGTGVAHAEDVEEPPKYDPDAEVCVFITTYTGVVRPMCLFPTAGEGGGASLGYGSFGTGSLADLLTGIINTGSVVLSVEVPNSTGSYAPGSTGSYGPEASVGQVLTGSVGSAGGSV